MAEWISGWCLGCHQLHSTQKLNSASRLGCDVQSGKGSWFQRGEMAQILKTQIFHVLFYIHFHFNTVVSLTVCFPSSTNTWWKKIAFCLSETVPACLCVPFLQSKQRNRFVDTQLMPLDGKINLNVYCGLLGQPFGALQSRCHRCVTGVSQVWQRQELKYHLLSQCGTLTGKFLFFLCSRTLWENAQKFFDILSWIEKWPNAITGDPCF